MPNTPPGSRPDPMMREVNRLLAQLERTSPRTERLPEAPPSQPQLRTKSAEIAASSSSRRSKAGLWFRVALGFTLGVMMAQWPYPNDCNLPLLGYLGAVATLLLAGAGTGFDSWKLRQGLAHILSLLLIFWGIVLAAQQVLPRIGYAADRASWRCEKVAPREAH
jgi:hypothetical protein